MKELELYRILHEVDIIDHVTIRCRQGKGMDVPLAKKLIRTHAGLNDEPLPDLTGATDEELNRKLVAIRERLMAPVE